MPAIFFLRTEQFKVANFLTEALVSMDRWAEVSSLLYIIFFTRNSSQASIAVSENIITKEEHIQSNSKFHFNDIFLLYAINVQ